MISCRKALFLIHCCIGIAGFHVPGALAQDAKVDVCHIPPGNPENAHTITISEYPAPSACTCPRAGVWRVTNLEGWMECQPFGIKRKDSCADKNDGAYKVENEEFITGEYHMEMSAMGMQCTGFTPFEIKFLKPLSEKDYAKLEKQMQKELEKARATMDEHREQIDAYLEKTGGGKAFGGRNSGE